MCIALVMLAALAGCGVLPPENPSIDANGAGADALQDMVPDDAVVYAAMPHPDDEFQAWSLLENSSHFTAIVLMTRGERTLRCTAGRFAQSWQEGLEIPPSPTPEAMEDETCVKARLDSIRGYLRQMSETDNSIPGDFAEGFTVTDLIDDDGVVCSRESGDQCTQVNLGADVWLDRRQRGALIAFDLGDANLTEAEVEWAMTQLRDQPAKFGIDPERPDGYVVSGYYNDGDPDCFEYPHADHQAVASVVDSVDLGLGLQLVATCSDPGENVLNARVSERSADAAFEFRGESDVEGAVRRGAHEAHYGWLAETVWLLDREGQQELFMQNQTFVFSGAASASDPGE